MGKKIEKIALIGASSNKVKYGNIILLDLIRKGYQVYPVNPITKKIEGIDVYSDVTQLPPDIDLYVFVVPWKFGLEIVTGLIKAGKNNFWFQPGAEHSSIREELEKHTGINFSFERCIMVKSKVVGDLEL